MTEKLKFIIRYVRFELFYHANIQQSIYRTLIRCQVLFQTLKTQGEMKTQALFLQRCHSCGEEKKQIRISDDESVVKNKTVWGVKRVPQSTLQTVLSSY